MRGIEEVITIKTLSEFSIKAEKICEGDWGLD